MTAEQYQTIEQAILQQSVVSGIAGQTYAQPWDWQGLLTGENAAYGVGYVPVLGNVYFARVKLTAEERRAYIESIQTMKSMPPDPNGRKPEKKPSREKFDAYLDDIEKKTGIKFTQRQRDALYDALENEEFYLLTPKENSAWRDDFNNTRLDLIAEWERQTGQHWPRYAEHIYNSDGEIIRYAGTRYDAHHIFENHYSGSQQWWNITPAHTSNHMQIHQQGLLANTFFLGN